MYAHRASAAQLPLRPLLAVGIQMLRNFIFDFDGTLADSGALIFQNMAQSVGISDMPSFHELRRYSAQDLLKRLNISKLELPKLIYKVHKNYKLFLPQVPLFQGMKESLGILHTRGARLFLCTSNSVENVRDFLEMHQLNPLFEDILGTMALLGKARGIRSTMKKFRLESAETVYVGDETRDIEAARKAGVYAASVVWGYNERELLLQYKPDFIVENSAELLRLLET